MGITRNPFLFLASLLAVGFLLFPRIGQGQLLWEIRHDSLEHPSYLMGTIHIDDPRVLAFDSVVYEKLDSCEAMAGELLMDQGSVMGSLHLFFLPKEQRLGDFYPDTADYKLIKKALRKSMGMYAGVAERFKPILLVFLIQEEGLMEPTKEKGEVLDLHLQSHAKKRGKELLGVETIGEQMAALDVIPLADQAQMLLDAVRQLNDSTTEAKDEMERMAQLYLAQDIEGMVEYANSEQESYDPLFAEAILANRNPVMAQRIGQMCRDQPTFVAIGSAHLGGPNGVVALLRQQGYELVALPFGFRSPAVDAPTMPEKGTKKGKSAKPKKQRD